MTSLMGGPITDLKANGLQQLADEFVSQSVTFGIYNFSEIKIKEEIKEGIFSLSLSLSHTHTHTHTHTNF